MCCKTLLLCYSVYLILNFSVLSNHLIKFPFANGQQQVQFFRKDYTYQEVTRSFYKYHATGAAWKTARKLCTMEGATLFYPESQQESQLVLNLSKNRKLDIHIGITDLMSEGFWETVDGKSLDNLYANWIEGQPDNWSDNQHCGLLKLNGQFDDRSCIQIHPFVCKKTLESLQWNEECNMPVKDYAYSNETGRCYRLSRTPMKWRDAYGVCVAEESHLAVINSQQEADYLVAFMAAGRKEQLGSETDSVHVGIHQRTGDGWQTVDGATLEESGYSVWGGGEPSEECGAMAYNGTLVGVGCDTKLRFVCEHEVTAAKRSAEAVETYFRTIDVRTSEG